MTALFIDLGVQRVQTWISESPRLLGIRGASLLLDSVDVNALASSAGLAVVENAPRVSGVLHLAALTMPTDDRASAREALMLLRDCVPGAEIVAAWARAETYLDAAPVLASALMTRDPARTMTSLPTRAEIGFLQRCDDCDRETATEAVLLREDQLSLCSTCDTKVSAAGRANDNGSLPQAYESMRDRVTADLQNTLALSLSVAPDLESLVAGDDPQIAVIVIDGNQVGDRFSALAGDSAATLDLSQRLSDATAAALAAAASRTVDDGEDIIRTQPHYVGGDDVFVTVQATKAWSFVTHFLDVFGRAFVAEGLTASAGVCFCHRTYPLAEGRQRAERALRDAKAMGMGVEATIGWVDVTAGAGKPMVVSLDAVERGAISFDELRGYGAHGRSVLTQASAAGDSDRITTWLEREGTDLGGLLTGGVAGLGRAEALSIARWWR